MTDKDSTLVGILLEEIRRDGPLSFARYMEVCLYHPHLGYYTRGLGGGGGRDYLTSSGLHRAYGVLIARQVEEMWARLGKPDPFLFVEFGPGEGCFAADLLSEAARRPGFARCLRYLLVESSPALAARQRARLAGRTAVPVAWLTEAELERRSGFSGVVFANEVLDAFPVHRIVGTAEGPREIFVGADGGRLLERVLPLSGEGVRRFLDESGVVLEDGQEADLNLAAPCWLSWAVRLPRRGYIIIVDYGHEARELYRPERRRGTLLAYHRHRTNEEFLARPGEQDLTAHLDFTALRRAAEAAGARVLGTLSQSRFLLALGAMRFLAPAATGAAVGAAPEATLDRIREREALKELILPDRMGEKFTVLIAGTADAPRDLLGLREPWADAREAAAARPGLPAAPAGREE
ncbi:MAG: class I SAM-dependent methyltransferase [Candidatus Polarisedimenticolia bacterium]